jgi:predicted acylesterase/phospholipase RssA
MNDRVFHNMVLSGGSFKALCVIGCIRYLEEHEMMKDIKTFVGTSAGSILCLLATLGMSSHNMETFIKLSITKDYIANLDINECFDILQSYGMNTGTIIERLIADVLMQTLGVGDITFLDLAKQTGKNLVVCVGNLTKEREEFWNVDTTPNVSIIKAIRASCSLPLIFIPVWHKGDVYVDGGIYNHFPINYFGSISTMNNIPNVIGVVIESLPNPSIDSIFTYIKKLLTSTLNVACSKNIPQQILSSVVSIQTEDRGLFSLDSMKISLTNDIIDDYIIQGYNETKKQIII